MAIVEVLVEALTPPLALLLLVGAACALLVNNPSGTPWSLTELGLLSAALGGGTGHVAARALHLTGQRQPRRAVVAAAGTGICVGVALVLGLPALYRWRCEAPAALLNAASCRALGMIGHSALHHAAWDGAPVWLLACAFGAMLPLGALAFRDLRLMPSRQGLRLWEEHALNPAPKPPAARVKACRNMTLSGQPCGAWYPEELPLDACPGCDQAFRPAELVDIEVWGMNTVDLRALNQQARANRSTREPGRSFSRPQRESPWILYGRLTDVPEVLSMAQTLALVHAHLDFAAETNKQAEPTRARELLTKASRLSAWCWLTEDVWIGDDNESCLLRVKPDQVRLAAGATRLSELTGLRRTAALRIQLDQGLLPLNVHWAYRFEGTGSTVSAQQDLWVPVAPPDDEGGRWVPRLAGDAVRTWLSDLGRGEPGVELQARLRHEEGKLRPATPHAHRPMELLMLPRGSLMAIEESAEVLSPGLGDWLADWDWLGADKIQQLRQQVLVTTTREDR